MIVRVLVHRNRSFSKLGNFVKHECGSLSRHFSSSEPTTDNADIGEKLDVLRFEQMLLPEDDVTDDSLQRIFSSIRKSANKSNETMESQIQSQPLISSLPPPPPPLKSSPDTNSTLNSTDTPTGPHEPQTRQLPQPIQQSTPTTTTPAPIATMPIYDEKRNIGGDMLTLVPSTQPLLRRDQHFSTSGNISQISNSSLSLPLPSALMWEHGASSSATVRQILPNEKNTIFEFGNNLHRLLQCYTNGLLETELSSAYHRYYGITIPFSSESSMVRYIVSRWSHLFAIQTDLLGNRSYFIRYTNDTQKQMFDFDKLTFPQLKQVFYSLLHHQKTKIRLTQLQDIFIQQNGAPFLSRDLYKLVNNIFCIKKVACNNGDLIDFYLRWSIV